MRASFSNLLYLTGFIALDLFFSANAGVIPQTKNNQVYNVMLLEADMKSLGQCEKTKWASNQAKESIAYGFWFCKGSVLGRLVDEHFFANIHGADLVHFVVKPGARCSENYPSPLPDRDVYIYLGNSKNNKVNIIGDDDERAIKSEFVQTAISVLETEANSACNPTASAFNVTSWGWETLSGIDF